VTYSVIHLTTLHPRTDTRIRLKESQTLAARLPHPVTLMVADGLGSTDPRPIGDVSIQDLGVLPSKRRTRVFVGSVRAFVAIRRLRPTVVHFHDAELLLLGFALKALGIAVVYDVHEDFPKVALGRGGRNGIMRQCLAWGVGSLEWCAARVFDLVVPATPSIARRFPMKKTVVVQNFPIRSELVAAPIPYQDRPSLVTFVGYISAERAALEMVRAVGLLAESNLRLDLAGQFSPEELHAAAAREPGWSSVNFHGVVDREEMSRILGRARAGLVLFHPLPNHLDAQPNKMFEYMSAGLPVVASDFPLWREIIVGAGCGLLTDPQDPEAIASALQWILDNPVAAEAMGRRGREAVEATYNWEVQAARLIEAYDRLIPAEPASR
jgi:glycosyltransferase involved in cell wall biosynthesis